jgi:hypothetical protein
MKILLLVVAIIVMAIAWLLSTAMIEGPAKSPCESGERFLDEDSGTWVVCF